MRLLAAALLASLFVAAVAEPATGPGWRLAPPIPSPRKEFGFATWRSEVVVAGGVDAADTTARVDAYSPRTRRWRRLPPLPEAMHGGMAAASAGRLYVVGGATSKQLSYALYVLSGRRWKPLKTMPRSRGAAGTAVIGNRLYVVGGVTYAGSASGTVLATSMLAYDFRSGGWIDLVGPTPRENLAVAARGGLLYAIGGTTVGPGGNDITGDVTTDLVEVYNPRTNQWRKLAPIPEARTRTAAVTVSGMIVAAGGQDNAFKPMASVYALDDADRWRPLPRLRVARYELGLGAVDGRTFAVTGTRGSQSYLLTATTEVLTSRPR
ncbi:MAG: Kelch repeat-containing protein [Gaiellaceae bacterium]